MRVALVHDWLTGLRGGEKVLEAIAELFPGAPIYTLFHFPGSIGGEIERRKIVTSSLQRWPLLRSKYRWYLPFFPAAIEEFDFSGFDLVISTSHCVAKGVLPAPGARHVCYCHTPMRYAWDQEHAYFPKRTGPVAWLRGRALSRLRTWDVASVPRVDEFLANSSFVAERIRRYYGRVATVLAPPVDVSFFSPPPDPAPREYALVVAALAPYKRVDLAIRACAKRHLPLVIVGDGPERGALRRLAGPTVRFAGRVDGPELLALYRGARCFVQPGVEDFGIAAVEALACGTPVVALGRGGVTDMVEDGVHGVLYGPRPGTDDEHLDQLSWAIDKAARIGFNATELRHRAEGFSRDRFQRGFRARIETENPPAGPTAGPSERDS
ncbi:MAG: glycosyltransferase [Thermoanaerobaculia bacterium]|nr:glycosyltransferase [Thermoanaerobaculia bacterium]